MTELRQNVSAVFLIAETASALDEFRAPGPSFSSKTICEAVEHN